MAAWELNKTILKNSANLKAYYRFESGNLTVDSSGNGYTLTNNNVVAEGTGKYGGGADLGTTTNKSLSYANGLVDLSNSAVSFVTWVNFTTAPGAGETQRLIEWQSTVGTSRYLTFQYEDSAGTKRIRVDASNSTITYNTTLSTSTWYHLAFTISAAGTTRVYLNGAHVATGSRSTGTTATNKIVYGNNDGGTVQVKGIMDDTAIFTTELSADQIKELYEGRYIGEWMPQSNLSAIYHLNGSSTDTSGNNYHGTDTAITYSQANGKYVQGAGFNGSSSYIQCPAKILSVGAKTIMFWLKTSTVANQVVIASGIWDATSNGTSVYINTTTGYLTFQERQTVASPILSISTPASVCDGAWKHIACVWDGTTNANTGIIYVNGASVVTGTATATQSSQDNNTKIGRREGATPYYFTGNLDEIVSFSRALTAAEIRKWYAWSVGRYL